VHLVLENADNTARYLDRKAPAHYDAQWNDDFHHAAHVVSTGETYGYYSDFALDPVTLLAKSLATGFVYQGEPSGHWQGRKRGEPSRHLPATAFINFLQNHDQIGNRADAKRRADLVGVEPLRALTALMLLCPAIPMLFMGEEWATTRRFHFFCDFSGELRAAVRRGRQEEFAHMRKEEPGGAEAAHIDPNAEDIFRASQLDWGEIDHAAHKAHLDFVRHLLALRGKHIAPRLAHIQPGGHYDVHDARALHVPWTFADGARLVIAANLSPKLVHALNWRVPGRTIYASVGTSNADMIDALQPWSVCVRLAEGAS
jgi:malto-oligosyltrehalose trehalohydrolase